MLELVCGRIGLQHRRDPKMQSLVPLYRVNVVGCAILLVHESLAGLLPCRCCDFLGYEILGRCCPVISIIAIT